MAILRICDRREGFHQGMIHGVWFIHYGVGFGFLDHPVEDTAVVVVYIIQPEDDRTSGHSRQSLLS